jgi:hypothetical protein
MPVSLHALVQCTAMSSAMAWKKGRKPIVFSPLPSPGRAREHGLRTLCPLRDAHHLESRRAC